MKLEPWGSCPECDRPLRVGRDRAGGILAVDHPRGEDLVGVVRRVRCARYSQLTPLAFIAWVEHVRRQPRPTLVAVPVGSVIWDRAQLGADVGAIDPYSFLRPVFQLIGFKVFGERFHPDHRGWIDERALEHFELVGWKVPHRDVHVPCVCEPAPELPGMLRVRPKRPCPGWELVVRNTDDVPHLFVFARADFARVDVAQPKGHRS